MVNIGLIARSANPVITSMRDIQAEQSFEAIVGEKQTTWRRILVRLRDFEVGREDKPGGMFRDRNCLCIHVV
ncbi:MAG TPA: hypothetical protein DDY14_04515 [Chromatiaceae bacterium]|jgi:hypothetical protein|nr:hypothetical protein [Chromatiaceae bacterium]